MGEKLPLDAEFVATLYRVLRLDGFFPEFTVELAAKVFPRSGLYAYASQAHVLEQGEEGRDLYIVRSGKVSISQTFGSAGAELTVLGPGDVFGEIGLIKDGVRRATATATVDSAVYCLAFADVQYLLKNNPALGAHLQALATVRLDGKE